MISLKDETILLVDDNIINLMIAERVLQSEGARVIKVSGGMEAIDALNQDSSITLVLLDLEMPDPDGYTTAQLIRNSGELFANVEIVALSAAEDEGSKVRAANAGISHFLHKPIKTAALLALLAQETSTLSNSGDHFVQKSAFYNLDYIKMASGEDPDSMKILANIILEESPVLFNEALESLKYGDGKNTASILHKLKGQLGIFSMTEATHIISGIENQCIGTDIDAKIIESQIMRLRDDVYPAFEEIKELIVNN